jgi:hypothetical protein
MHMIELTYVFPSRETIRFLHLREQMKVRARSELSRPVVYTYGSRGFFGGIAALHVPVTRPTLDTNSLKLHS